MRQSVRVRCNADSWTRSDIGGHRGYGAPLCAPSGRRSARNLKSSSPLLSQHRILRLNLCANAVEVGKERSAINAKPIQRTR